MHLNNTEIKHKWKAANLPHPYSEEPALLLTCAGFTSVALRALNNLVFKDGCAAAKVGKAVWGQDGAVNEAGRR